MNKGKTIFKIARYPKPEVLNVNHCEEYGMDENGNVYAYGTGEWCRVYNWNPAEKGIFDGWTEKLDNGYNGNLVYRGGLFYLNNNWNQAEQFGFQLRLWEYRQFKRVYHLLFDKHFQETGKVEYPALLDYIANIK